MLILIQQLIAPLTIFVAIFVATAVIKTTFEKKFGPRVIWYSLASGLITMALASLCHDVLKCDNNIWISFFCMSLASFVIFIVAGYLYILDEDKFFPRKTVSANKSILQRAFIKMPWKPVSNKAKKQEPLNQPSSQYPFSQYDKDPKIIGAVDPVIIK